MGRREQLRLLLDTHIFLWALLEPARLSERVARELEASANQLWLSPITTWEVLLLAERGRLELDVDPVSWLRGARARLPLREAPLTHEVAIKSRQLELPHHDPADRFLAATASVFDLTLVTADELLLRGEGFAVLPNR